MKHHLCIYDDYSIFDEDVLPIGKVLIEKETTKAIGEILEMIVHTIKQGEVVVVCGEGDARRMLGRKLEDRLKEDVVYE